MEATRTPERIAEEPASSTAQDTTRATATPADSMLERARPGTDRPHSQAAVAEGAPGTVPAPSDRDLQRDAPGRRLPLGPAPSEVPVALESGTLPARSRGRLQRLQPRRRAEVITLDRASCMIGRHRSCDIRLYTQTASREHARLTSRDGRWYVQPVDGRIMLVDGKLEKNEVLLRNRMRLQFGGDELVFLDDTVADIAATAARTEPVRNAGRRRSTLYLVAALVIAALVAIAVLR
jgi:hypothetical protein